MPTVRNPVGYDVAVSNLDGTRHANLQLKASLRGVHFFPMPPVEKVRAGSHNWYVLLRWLKAKQRWDVFLLTGRQVKAEVHGDRLSRTARMRAGRRAFFPAITIGACAGQRPDAWRRCWKSWKL